MKKSPFKNVSQKIEKWGIEYISPKSQKYENLENNGDILVSSGNVFPDKFRYSIGARDGIIYVVCKPEIVENLKLFESSIKYELSKKIWLLGMTKQTKKDLYEVLQDWVLTYKFSVVRLQRIFLKIKHSDLKKRLIFVHSESEKLF